MWPRGSPANTRIVSYAQCWADVGPASTTLAQHQPNIGTNASCLLVGACGRSDLMVDLVQGSQWPNCEVTVTWWRVRVTVTILAIPEKHGTLILCWFSIYTSTNSMPCVYWWEVPVTGVTSTRGVIKAYSFYFEYWQHKNTSYGYYIRYTKYCGKWQKKTTTDVNKNIYSVFG